MHYYIGQALGILAIIFGFISYQTKTKKQLIIAQSATALCFCLDYLLIGAYTGLAVNAVVVVRNILYYFQNQKGKTGWAIPAGFACLMGVMGALAWDGWFSLFSIAGLIINTLAMSSPDPQIVRKSILVSSPMVVVYNVFVLNIVGIVYESVVIVSSTIGLFRNGKQEKAVKQA